MDVISLQAKLILQLALAFVLGVILGVERSYLHKTAGSRTFALVTVGSALFTMLSRYGFADIPHDPTRIAANVVAGIGFVGMGVLIHKDAGVTGITTAAGMWLAAAVGMAVGFEFYLVALATTLLGLVSFWLLRVIEFEHLVTRIFSGNQADHHDIDEKTE